MYAGYQQKFKLEIPCIFPDFSLLKYTTTTTTTPTTTTNTTTTTTTTTTTGCYIWLKKQQLEWKHSLEWNTV